MAEPTVGSGGDIGVLLAELEKARADKTRTQRFVTIGIIVVILVFGYLNYVTISSFDAAGLQTQFGQQLEQRMPDLSEEAMGLVEELGPVYYAEVQRALPELTPIADEKMMQEWESFHKEMKASIDEHMANAKNMLAEKHDFLQKEIPELKDKEDTIKKLRRLEERLKDDLTGAASELMSEHIKLLAEIDQSLIAIGKDAPADLEEQNPIVILGICFELMGSRMTEAVNDSTATIEGGDVE